MAIKDNLYRGSLDGLILACDLFGAIGSAMSNDPDSIGALALTRFSDSDKVLLANRMKIRRSPPEDVDYKSLSYQVSRAVGALALTVIPIGILSSLLVAPDLNEDFQYDHKPVIDQIVDLSGKELNLLLRGMKTPKNRTGNEIRDTIACDYNSIYLVSSEDQKVSAGSIYVKNHRDETLGSILKFSKHPNNFVLYGTNSESGVYLRLVVNDGKIIAPGNLDRPLLDSITCCSIKDAGNLNVDTMIKAYNESSLPYCLRGTN
jgi:hypothetical protein